MDNKKNNNHSFYKEANKSILGQQQMTPKKFIKGIMKALKWLLFLFLIVITLWGCVNEFIIQTSKNLGQGVEFYQADDFVYPNMYQAYQVAGYTATDYKVTTTEIDVNAPVEDKDAAVEANKAAPLNGIKVANQAYGLTDANIVAGETSFVGFENGDATSLAEINTTDAYVSANEAVTVSFDSEDKSKVKTITHSPSYFAYNLNEVTVLATGILGYDSADVVSGNDLYTATTVVPYELRKDITADYSVSSVAAYTFYNDFDTDGNDEYVVTADDLENPIYNWSDNIEAGDAISHADLLSMNGTINVADGSFIANFKGQGLTEEEQQYRTFVNNIAFTSGIGSTVGLESVLTWGQETYGITSGYNADYSGVVLNNGGAKIYGGSEVFVIPTEKGKPVQLSKASQDVVNAMRAEDFTTAYDDATFKYSGDSFDPETQMYGWTLASASLNEDGTHDVMKSYNDISIAAGETIGEQNTIVNEDASIATDDGFDANGVGYFFADQRREGWGIAESSADAAAKGVTIFDDKIKDMMNSDVYTQLTRSVTINDESYTYTTGAKFAGMTSFDQIQTTDESYMGVIPKVETSDVNWKGQERSILSDSIIPTREDAYGENRVAFVGWEDWGKAWEIQYGPLYGTVVFPLAQISMGIGEWFNYMDHPWGTLASIALLVFLTRGLGALLSINGTKNQLKMQEVQTEVAKIKARYSKYDLKEDKKMKQKQQTEIMALYRKNDINPMGSLGTIFITMPIFISLWIIISALPAYKLVIMGNFSWAISAWAGIFGGFGALFLIYLMVGIAVGLVQGVSSKLPAWLSNKRKGIKRLDEATKEASKKNNKTQNIMIGVFIFMGLTVPALFAFYWICSGLFTIFLELMRHSWRVHTAKKIKENPAYLTPGVRMANSFKKKIKWS